ncbi:MAG: XrtB/PEP-CTERM-associated transcriptional regulator EpsA [Candidatus Omnitrophota bacterium]
MVKAISLTEEESLLLVSVLEASLYISKRDQFFSWLQGSFQSLIPHEILICGSNLINESELIFESYSTTRYLTSEHIKRATLDSEGIVKRVICAWKKNHRPILISSNLPLCDFDKYCVPFKESEEVLRDSELRNIAAHGLYSKDGNLLTFFSFSRIPGEPCPKHAHILELLVPQLHHLLLRVLGSNHIHMSEPKKDMQGMLKKEKQLISPREVEVMKWVSLGKTNLEISVILCVSINTIKNQVHSTILKLGVENRMQACAIAHKLGLLE